MSSCSEYITTQGKGLSRQKIACVVLLVVFSLPFVNKAIHIDDIAFLRLDALLDWNPLRAFPHASSYQGILDVKASPYELSHPLLIPYILKILQHFFGVTERWLHLVFLAFPALALWSLAKFEDASAVGRGPVALPLLVLFGSLPAFFVNGQNLMTDVPTLAFLLAGTAVFVQNEHGQRPWSGSFWLSCAIFSSYQALFFIPVLIGFVATGCQGVRRWQLIRALLFPVALMAAWLLLVYANHGLFPLLKSQVRDSIGSEISRGLQWQVLGPKAIFILAMTGASLLFVLPVRFCSVRLSGPWQKGLLLLALAVGLFLLSPEEAGAMPRRAMLAFWGAIGLFGLGLAFLEIKGWYAREETRALAVLCGGWIGVTLLLNMLALPFGSARYLLPLFPILFIVLLRGSNEATFRFPRLATALLFGSLLWGGANAWADYFYAGTYRTMAAELAEFRRSLGPGQRIWYIGEWGMRHYFDQAGAHYLLAGSTEPRPGDFVVIPEMPRFWAPSPALQPRLNFYASREFRSPFPLRLFNRRSGAGFYCHHWGLLPFTFSSEPDEVFIIQEVR